MDNQSKINISEAPETARREIDLSYMVPDLAPYLRGRRVVNVEEVPPAELNHYPSSLRAIRVLTRAASSREVGDYGPAMAASSLNPEAAAEMFRLYSDTVFGRDSLRVAHDLIDHYPKLVRSTLLKLAESQGEVYRSEREEEPGRIAHEIRDPKTDPIARRLSGERGWGWPYYGSVDATVEFIRLFAASAHRQTNPAFLLDSPYISKSGQTKTLADAFDAAVKWTARRLDANPEGLLEHKPAFPGSIENQVWKDSLDAYFHADGTLANHNRGVASVEVQAAAYDALIDAAELYEEFINQPQEAIELRHRADNLRQQILEVFWTDEKDGYFVLGTDRGADGRLRQLKVRTSNMGHLLNSRLLDGKAPDIMAKKQAVVRQLFSPQLLNASGIRTLANDEVRFAPTAYHNGSVWLWDTYFIAQGLERQGYFGLADRLMERILRIAEQTKLFPEYVKGDDSPTAQLSHRIVDVWEEEAGRINRLEQPPQQIQAWSAAAVLAIKLRTTGRTENHSPDSEFERTILRSIPN